jgi:hypothetical protein
LCWIPIERPACQSTVPSFHGNEQPALHVIVRESEEVSGIPVALFQPRRAGPEVRIRFGLETARYGCSDGDAFDGAIASGGGAIRVSNRIGVQRNLNPTSASPACSARASGRRHPVEEFLEQRTRSTQRSDSEKYE